MAENINTNITRQAPFLEDHIANLLASGQTLIDTPYMQYGDPRIAGFAGDQTDAFNIVRSGIGAYVPFLAGSSDAANYATQYFDSLSPAAQQALMSGQAATDVSPYLNAGTSYVAGAIPEAQDWTRSSTGLANLDPYIGAAYNSAQSITGQWDNSSPEARQYYRDAAVQGDLTPFMNPYQQNVIDATVAEMNRQKSRDLIGVNAKQAMQGSFGGSRHALAEAEVIRNNDRAVADAVAQMNYGNIQNAQQMNEAYRNRQFQTGTGIADLDKVRAGLAGQDAGIYRDLAALSLQAQEGQFGRMAGAGQNIGNLGFNAANSYTNLGSLSGSAQDSTGSRLLTSGQALGNLGQLGAANYLDQSRILSGIGGLSQQYNQADATMLSQIGAMQQGQQQAALDVNYNNWLENQMQPYQRLGFFSDILHGVPTSQNTITASTSPQRSALAQGLGAIGQFASAGQQFGWWGNKTNNTSSTGT